jgi:hypothetical protein
MFLERDYKNVLVFDCFWRAWWTRSQNEAKNLEKAEELLTHMAHESNTASTDLPRVVHIYSLVAKS